MDFRTLYIRQKVQGTKVELFLKTDAGRPDVETLISTLRSRQCSRRMWETALPVFFFIIGRGTFSRRQIY